MLTRKPAIYATVAVDLAPDSDWGVAEVEAVAEAAGAASFVVIGGTDDPLVRTFVEFGADHHLAAPNGSIATLGSLDRVETVDIEATSLGDGLYRTIVESMLDGLWLLDLNGTIIFVNPQMAAMLGHEVEELEGRSAFDFMAEAQLVDRRVGLLRRRLGLSDRHEICMITQAGEERWHLSSIRPVLDEDGLPVAVIAAFADVSNRRKLERQLLQAHKMEAIGHLAGGVAHDFNNLLTLIGGYATLVSRRFEEGDEGLAETTEIQNAVAQASSLTRQLLAFSRQSTPDVKRLNVNEVIDKTRNMLSRLMTEDVELVTRLDADPADVVMDSGLLEQIVTNLCVNARDAMPDGGTVVIETRAVTLDHRAEEMLGSGSPGDHVCVTVSDSGMGMDEQTRSQIFEPFFTTKEPGKGTGLGLATVYGIVDQNQGLISMYSEPGEGTTVRIHLPAADVDAVVEGVEQRQDGPAVTRRQTALLVEDNDGVRAFSRRVLTDAGFEVLEAGVPSEALAHAKHFGESIDLLVTDIVMPEMNGKVLAQQIAQDLPGIRVVYVSGFAHGKVAHDGDLLDDSAFVAKPFTAAELLDAAGQSTQPIGSAA